MEMNKENSQLLFTAVENNNIEAVRSLLTSEVNINENTKVHEETLLHVAAKNGYKEIAADLLKAEANFNSVNEDGKTALQLAIGRCDFDLATILIDAGANVNTKDSNGQTLLHEAAKMNNHAIIEFLLFHDVDVNTKDLTGWTPLHCAANENEGSSHLNTIKTLLENGADPLALDKKFDNPVSYLVKEPKFEVIKLFTDYMRQASMTNTPVKKVVDVQQGGSELHHEQSEEQDKEYKEDDDSVEEEEEEEKVDEDTLETDETRDKNVQEENQDLEEAGGNLELSAEDPGEVTREIEKNYKNYLMTVVMYSLVPIIAMLFYFVFEYFLSSQLDWDE